MPSSGPQGSDYGYALKRFLLEHESERGSQLGDDPILEEAVNEPSAVPSNSSFPFERQTSSNFLDPLKPPVMDPRNFLQASEDCVMPE